MFAGYARYLTGINDAGERFTQSPDPNLPVLTPLLADFALGKPIDQSKLQALFSRADIFGVDLYAYGLGEKVEHMFTEMSTAVGAIRATLNRYLQEAR